ncbi:MAG: TetR/AcrR family transcriptional regulator [Microthrixaceae bacterium]|nr:TetR/AcrR family transcriptional regulator [Microthrixaceae bacterium]
MTAKVITKGEQTRRAILVAAIERFGRDGFRATSVADIAREAGVSGTAAYAYFPNKEALFLAAIDEDAAAVIHEGLSVLEGPSLEEWRRSLVFTLIDSVERHPLARRLLSGLEPEVTDRVMGIPALEELRKAIAERLRSEQAAGVVRADIDPVVIGNGVVAIVLSLLVAMVQVDRTAALTYADDVAAVFAAAIEA